MKKLIILLFSLLLLTACSSNTDTKPQDEKVDKTIKVSCTAEPHATILEFVKPQLESLGYELEIEILDNYYIFNEALSVGDVDANYFQHIPFFEGELASKGFDLVNAGGVHIEPFGIYSKKYKTVDEIEDGAKVIISNSIADHGRILIMLEEAGLITINEGINPINATINDIQNPKNLRFDEVNPEFLTTAFSNDEADLVAINGNYAIGAGLNPVNDAVILESATNENPYVNIVACRKGDENSEKIKALMEVLTNEETKNYITEHFAGSVIPVE